KRKPADERHHRAATRDRGRGRRAPDIHARRFPIWRRRNRYAGHGDAPAAPLVHRVHRAGTRPATRREHLQTNAGVGPLFRIAAATRGIGVRRFVFCGKRYERGYLVTAIDALLLVAVPTAI